MANLRHCFPDAKLSELERIERESASRMVEMALFVVSSPHLSRDDLKKRVVISDYVEKVLLDLREKPRPVVLLIPHFCMMETISMFPLVSDVPPPRAGAIYRPFDNPSLESWVKSSRQRFGIELISRRTGLRHAMEILHSGGCVAVLFDQDAGRPGLQTLFFDRYCQASDLPGILAEHEKAETYVFYAVRTGFWRSRIEGQKLCANTIEQVTISSNEWLENRLKTDQTARFDWLWLHRRWKGYSRSLSDRARKSVVDIQLNQRKMGAPKRTFGIYISTSGVLRDTLAALPVVRLIANSRADAFVTLICPKEFAPLLENMGVAHRVLGVGNFSMDSERVLFYKRLSDEYADIHISFEDTPIADKCSKALKANFSIGISSARKRRGFDALYKADAASSLDSLTHLFEAFARNFGACGELDLSPFELAKLLDADCFKRSPAGKYTDIAILCGGAGVHAWSAEKWAELIKMLDRAIPNARFVVFGDEADQKTAYNIALYAPNAEVETYSNPRGLCATAYRMEKCKIAVGTDCRLSHIANAIGIPTVALFGPTNPLRRGLVFNAPKREITPKDCPPQGGMSVDFIEPHAVCGEALILLSEQEKYDKNRNGI